MNLFTETATLRHPGEPTGEYDDFGDPALGPGREVDAPAWWEIRSTSRDVDGKDQTTDGYWLYLPLGTEMHHDSEARIGGAWYKVAGEPGTQPGGFLIPGYIRVPLTLTRG